MFGATKQVSVTVNGCMYVCVNYKQMFQPNYTMLGHNWLDERGAEGTGYIRAVGSLFPKQLLYIMPDMQEIVQNSLEVFAKAHKSQTGTSHGHRILYLN